MAQTLAGPSSSALPTSSAVPTSVVEEVDEAEQIEKIEEEVVTGREAEAIVRPAEAEEAEEVVEQRQQPVRPELRPVYESEVAEAKTGHRITAAAALALVTVVAAIAWRRRA